MFAFCVFCSIIVSTTHMKSFGILYQMLEGGGAVYGRILV